MVAERVIEKSSVTFLSRCLLNLFHIVEKLEKQNPGQHEQAIYNNPPARRLIKLLIESRSLLAAGEAERWAALHLVKDRILNGYSLVV